MQRARIKTDENGVLILLRIKPRAGRNQIEGVPGDRVLVSVTAAPHDGAANDSVIDVLADALHIAKSRIETRARLEPFLPES